MTSQGWSNPRQALVVSFINCKSMSEVGWVKIHRQLLEWEWYQKSEMVHLFLHFLLLANHQDNSWQGQVIKAGQFITGLDQLSKDTGISRQTIRTCINRLKSTGELTYKSTNKYRIITLTKYSDYQSDCDKLTGKLTPKLTNNQQSTNNQLTANKNDKNDNNEQEERELELTPNKISQDFFNNVNSEYRLKVLEYLLTKGLSEETIKSEMLKFISYWTELTGSGRKQRWETQKTFEVNRRLATWFSNISNFNKAGVPKKATMPAITWQ